MPTSTTLPDPHTWPAEPWDDRTFTNSGFYVVLPSVAYKRAKQCVNALCRLIPNYLDGVRDAAVEVLDEFDRTGAVATQTIQSLRCAVARLEGTETELEETSS